MSHPDTDRPAAEDHILYSFRRCPYAMRARLAVQSSRTKVVLREIVLRDKPDAFLAVSPTATVPALVTGSGKVLDESLDIMLWALENNDPEGWLTPENGTLDDMLALIHATDGPFKTSLDLYKYHTRHPQVDPLAERQTAGEFLFVLDHRLSQTKYLFGAGASLADMAIAPFVRQFANVDRDWFDAMDWSSLSRWLMDFQNSERFAAIMEKYPKWVPGDPPTLFGA